MKVTWWPLQSGRMLALVLLPSLFLALSASAASQVVQVINSNSGMCVDIVNSGTSNGSLTIQSPCGSGLSQQWQLSSVSNGVYNLINASSSRCLDVPASSSAYYKQLEIWDCNGGANQQFTIKTSNGVSTLSPVNDGLCVDVNGASTSAGAVVQQYGCNGTGAQNFVLSSTSSGSVSTSSGIAVLPNGTVNVPVTSYSTLNGGRIESGVGTANDWGYVSPSESISFPLSVAKAGSYQFVLNYSSWDSNANTVISINGTAVGTIPFPSTGNYSTYANTSAVSINLPAGNVSLMFNGGAVGAFNLAEISIKGAISSLPDMVVTSVSRSPANPSAGQAVTFSATVMNQGGAATPVNVINGIGFSVDGVGVSWEASYSSSIAPGASVTLKADGGPNGGIWNASAGNHSVVAYVNDVGRFAESNSGNNTLALAFSVAAPASSSPSTLPPAIAGQNYSLSFDDEFTSNTISSGNMYNGAKWYNGVEQCCMVDSTGLPGVMYPSQYNGVSVDPYTLVNGGGLNITLSKVNNVWYSGVMTSVDSKGQGFSQQYGYFEIRAKLPAGPGTWPAFWMLNTANLTGNAVHQGEIDIFEQYGQFPNGFCTTLHDWDDGSTPYINCNTYVSDVTQNFHTWGLLWTPTTMSIYVDDVMVQSMPTPPQMQQPYYLLIDNGLGGYWPTNTTPNTNVMQVQWVRAYTSH